MTSPNTNPSATYWRARWASWRRWPHPTLVVDSEGSSGDLTGWAAAVLGALPNGSHRSLEGQWHGVPTEDLAPVLIEFFAR